jgi:hypothetical protein
MTEVALALKEHENLLRLTEHGVLDEIKKILSQFWLAPHEVSAQVKSTIERLMDTSSLRVVVSGETRNISLYVIASTEILAVTPFSSIESNTLLQEMYGAAYLPSGCTWHIFSAEVKLLRRLALPKVLFVNPCVMENFQIPRLSLSIGLLASYLRKFQKADVRIIDMQTGATIKDIMDSLEQINPDIFGLSISYGQKPLALSILQEVYRAKRERVIDSLVVLI